LLQQIRLGATSKLGRLLEIYRNYLNLLADSQLDGKLQARISASDIVQDTMMEAHRDFHQIRGSTEAEFICWLRRILVNNLAGVIEMHVRAENRDVRREVCLDRLNSALERSAIQIAASLAGCDETPSVVAERKERAVILADLMSELTPDHRQVLVLRYIKGLRFDEVAKKMNRSVSAAKMLWTRALTRLRQQYELRGET
jgi:RNA polymerase sigma-70 factor (ECF subfamily)